MSRAARAKCSREGGGGAGRADAASVLTPPSIHRPVGLPEIDPSEIAWGIVSVGRALEFLHDRGELAHNDVCLENVYIDERDNTWRLFGFEHAMPLPDFSKEYQAATSAFRSEKSATPEEGAVATNSAAVGARDVYAFATFIDDVLGACDAASSLSDLQRFSDRARAMCQPDAPEDRCSMSAILADPYLKNDSLVQGKGALDGVLLKPPGEKVALCQKLQRLLVALPPAVVIRHLLDPLFAQSMLADPVFSALLVQLLTPSNDAGAAPGVFPTDLFKEHIVPKCLELLESRSMNTRLVLLEALTHNHSALEEETLVSIVLPEVRAGLDDANDTLVQATLTTLAALVPACTEHHVLGMQYQRSETFTETATVRDAMPFAPRDFAPAAPAARADAPDSDAEPAEDDWAPAEANKATPPRRKNSHPDDDDGVDEEAARKDAEKEAKAAERAARREENRLKSEERKRLAKEKRGKARGAKAKVGSPAQSPSPKLGSPARSPSAMDDAGAADGAHGAAPDAADQGECVESAEADGDGDEQKREQAAEKERKAAERKAKAEERKRLAKEKREKRELAKKQREQEKLAQREAEEAAKKALGDAGGGAGGGDVPGAAAEPMERKSSGAGWDDDDDDGDDGWNNDIADEPTTAEPAAPAADAQAHKDANGWEDDAWNDNDDDSWPTAKGKSRASPANPAPGPEDAAAKAAERKTSAGGGWGDDDGWGDSDGDAGAGKADASVATPGEAGDEPGRSRTTPDTAADKPSAATTEQADESKPAKKKKKKGLSLAGKGKKIKADAKDGKGKGKEKEKPEKAAPAPEPEIDLFAELNTGGNAAAAPTEIARAASDSGTPDAAPDTLDDPAAEDRAESAAPPTAPAAEEEEEAAKLASSLDNLAREDPAAASVDDRLMAEIDAATLDDDLSCVCVCCVAPSARLPCAVCGLRFAGRGAPAALRRCPPAPPPPPPPPLHSWRQCVGSCVYPPLVACAPEGNAAGRAARPNLAWHPPRLCAGL